MRLDFSVEHLAIGKVVFRAGGLLDAMTPSGKGFETEMPLAVSVVMVSTNSILLL